MTTERKSEMEFLESRIVLSSYLPLLQLGTGANNLGVSTLTADERGNIYIAGAFQGAVDFDPRRNHATILESENGSFFIARYSPQGVPFWVIPLKGTPDVAALTTDGRGDLYVAGAFSFGKGGNRKFSTICKFHSDGSFAFVNARASGRTAGHVAVDQFGSIY